MSAALLERLDALIGELFPGARVESVRPLGGDEELDDEGTAKGTGYGRSLLLGVVDGDGGKRKLVLRTNRDGQFGHERRSDRAEGALLAYDTFGLLPRHSRALDVGAITDDGGFRSLRDCGEFYWLTDYAPGEPYADDLRRIASDGLENRDRRRSEVLAEYLARLHDRKIDAPGRYRRAIRDLIGGGEGLFGLADSYAADVPGAPLQRVRRLEAKAAEWRWRLRGREARLCRSHGDFHPFNILFEASGEPYLLDTSRGSEGDPADDTTCLSINYLFFALEHPGSWEGGFQALWRDFWRRYLELTGDDEVFETAPPYVAWRTLVLVSPIWYPQSPPEARAKLLDFAEASLDSGRLDIDAARELFS